MTSAHTLVCMLLLFIMRRWEVWTWLTVSGRCTVALASRRSGGSWLFHFFMDIMQYSERAISWYQDASLCPQILQRLSNRIGEGDDWTALIQKERGTIVYRQHTSFGEVLRGSTSVICCQAFSTAECSSSVIKKSTQYCCKQCNKSKPVSLCVIPFFSVPHYPSLRYFYFRILRILLHIIV